MSLVSIKQANTAANGTRELLNLVFQNLEAIDKSTLTTIQKIEIAKSFIKKIKKLSFFLEVSDFSLFV